MVHETPCPLVTMSMAVRASALVRTPVLATYGLASTVALAAVLLKAGLEQPDYLAAAAWLTNSNGCFLVLCNFAVYVLLLSGRIMQLVLFGTLRRSEEEKFAELLWYSMFNMFFTLTSFPIDFDLRFVLTASVLKFFQIFHILCDVRIDQMGQVTSLPRSFHLRMIALLSWLGTFDSVLVLLTGAISLQHPGPGGFMVYMASASIIQLVEWAALSGAYACECYELGLEEPWHAKSRYLFVIKLVSNLLMFLTYPVCYGLYIYNNSSMVTFFPPFSALRDFLVLGYSLFDNVRKLLRSRAATRDMESRYPRLTNEELQALQDPTCIICREELVVSPNERSDNNTPRKLACGHVFHFRCLHSWLERQQSCPTCRRSVLEPANAPALATEARAAPRNGPERDAHADQQPARPQASLHALLARFGTAVPTPSAGAGTAGAAASGQPRSPSEAARALLDNPRLNPRLVGDPGTPDAHDRSAQSSSSAATATATAHEAKPAEKDETPAGETPADDPREAVRRAALARFASATPSSVEAPAPEPGLDLAAPETMPAPASAPLASVPAFDPANLPDLAPMPTSASASGLDAVQGAEPPSIDTQLREQLHLLQESQVSLQQTIARIQQALRVTEEKGKARATTE